MNEISSITVAGTWRAQTVATACATWFHAFLPFSGVNQVKQFPIRRWVDLA